MRAGTRPAKPIQVIVGALALLILATLAPAPVGAVVGGSLLRLPDKDFRAGSIQPSSAQVTRANQLGATVRWNKFGTPQSVIKYGGWLATGLGGSPETAARAFIRNNRSLFRLSDTDVTRLELVAANPIGTGRAVLFRQRYGNLSAGHDGLIIVGVAGGKVAYASSSASGTMPAPAAASLSATQAWLRAAAHVGQPLTAAKISNVRTVNGWTVFSAAGLGTPVVNKQAVDQRARLVAVPTFRNGVRPAFEAIVLDTDGAVPVAYTVFVDARSGEILMRYNRVNHAAHDNSELDLHGHGENDAPANGQFTGNTDQANSCGATDGGINHPIDVPAGTRTITVGATATDPVNDIFIQLIAPDGTTVITENQETGTSPEALHWDFGTAIAADTYFARVCQFNAPDPSFPYQGVWATQDVASTGTDLNYPPKWKYFRAHPSLANDGSGDDPYDLVNNDTRLIGCWVTQHNGSPVADCSPSVGRLQNLAARAPWDHNVQSNTPSFTTIGNNAITGEAWVTPLTPGPLQQRPVHPDRAYVDAWTNVWNQSRCNPTNLVPAGNDIMAAVTNLFVAHNRMHDWTYFLGFTESAWNLQQNNFGNNPGAGQENDPEIGQAQAGALLPVEAGVSRDNANQITLNDGVPGVTNMYLWQPVAGGFYPPCVDGDYDMAVIGHEYGHAVSNRMAGGPDSNLTGTHAGAMGESWSDLMAMEYLNEFNLVPTNNESRYAVGAYATGNQNRGIRNYNMSTSPLNFSNVGYDFVCNAPLVAPEIEGTCPDGRTQVHADGEIWTATNFALRQALIQKWNGSFPASNTARQRACAEGTFPATQCPGNRRWMQIVFDAWLLLPGSITMLDARDAYLAADMIRFNGANQAALWKVFAQRGMGLYAQPAGQSTTDPGATEATINDPVPDFRSPSHGFKNVKFRVFAADEGNAPITTAKIYVGHYEAAVTPIADTISGGSIDDTAQFVAGDYEFVVAAPGYGHLRFPRTFTGTGNINVDVYMSTNRASIHKGAVPSGVGTAENPVSNLFDDTELTNWSGPSPVVPGAVTVTVDLQGAGVHNVKRINVSAMLNPDNGGRFRALRQFEIWACNETTAVGGCAVPTNFSKKYTSPANAFPGVRPRPTAPDLNLRSFDVPDFNATHVQLRVLSSQCTATGTGFRGDQDADPLNDPDCVSGSDADLDVKAAELQVFSTMANLPPRDPAVTVTTTAPATVATGSELAYEITYTNLGPSAANDAKLVDVLPEGLTFMSATDGGTYRSASRTVTWNLGTINVGFTGTRTLTVKVTAPAGTVLTNSAVVEAPLTTSVPVPAVTTVSP